MTELTLNKTVFLKTLDAFRTQFEVEKPEVILQSDPSGERFVMTGKRPNGLEVKAFGPCTLKGDQFSIEFDMPELQQAIIEAHAGSDTDELTLLIANGVWVKDPNPTEDN